MQKKKKKNTKTTLLDYISKCDSLSKCNKTVPFLKQLVKNKTKKATCDRPWKVDPVQ